jgi:puromycin-sensitive aminopeptidase
MRRVVTVCCSQIMSTYLVAFVVGEFEYVEARCAKTNVLVRVYTPLGKKEQGRFALDCGTKILDYFTEYFGIAYPLPKVCATPVHACTLCALRVYAVMLALAARA